MCLVASAASLALVGPAGAAATSSVTLTWTAPGDDGTDGVASRYDVRYSLAPITTANFDQATAVAGVPVPSAAGTRQQVSVTGLEPNRLYYFAIKAVDEAGNWSPMSNVAFKTAPDPTKPSALSPLSLSAAFPSPARDMARLDMTLPHAMTVRVVVTDVSGRLLTWLAAGSYPAGTTSLQWNLRDGAGRRVSAGAYWVLGVLGDARIVRRIAVVP